MREGIYSRRSATGKGYLNIPTRSYKDVGTHFGIAKSGMSQAIRHVDDKVRKDEKLTRKIAKIERNTNLSRMKT